MTTETPRRIDTTEVAKLLRKALKAEFPGTRFSVRSDRYAGGSSIHVRWTDGPTEPSVQAVCDRYRGGWFDGMRDLMEHHSSLLTTDDSGAELVHFSADHVMAERSISQPAYDQVATEITAATGEPCDLSRPVWENGRRVEGTANGTGWNTSYPALVVDGQVHRSSNTREGGNTLAHQALRNRPL